MAPLVQVVGGGVGHTQMMHPFEYVPVLIASEQDGWLAHSAVQVG